MVDLQGQYSKIKAEIHDAVQAVISRSAFVRGKEIPEFEQNLARYLQCRHAVTCANGTDALQISLMALNLQPGDEVITSPFTFFATVEVIVFLGLRPVFVDVRPDTFNMDVSQIEKAITPRTKVLLPVHLFGQCTDMEPLLEMSRRHNLFVIEDACQAIGTVYTFRDGHSAMAGTMGHLGCTSFFPSKNLGCFGDGGAIFTQDDALAARVRTIANHGSEVKYHHDRIGVNSRLDTIQAAILNVKLKYLDSYIHARQQAAARYDRLLASCPQLGLPIRLPFSSHTFHQYTLQLSENERNRVQDQLRAAGIPTMVYYPVPCHLQKALAYLGYQVGDFPVAERLARTVLSLPMHTELSENQQQYIVENLLSALSDR